MEYKQADHAYWNFTFADMAEYDVPANLEYILAKTGAKKLVYMGHSQGTAQWFIANTLYPNLHEKYAAFVGFAPVLYVGNVKSAMTQTLDMLEAPEFGMLSNLGVLTVSKEITDLMQTFVRYLPRTIWEFTSALCGFDDTLKVDLARLPMMANNDMGGTSAKNILHWAQSVRTGKVSRFDYGEQGNLHIYGTQ